MSDRSAPANTDQPAGSASAIGTRLRRLRVDGQFAPDHVDGPPRFSWIVQGEDFANDDAAYQVLVATDPAELRPDGRLVWDSGWVPTGGTNALGYSGPDLEPLRDHHWTVRVDDRGGQRSDWAPAATFSTGLLQAGEWTAPWVAAPWHDADESGRGSVSYLQTTFQVGADSQQVIACLTALGIYRAYCNGQRISDAELEPGWTDYTVRVQYQKHDLTDLVRPGQNSLEIVLADGWWAGHVGWFGRDLYGGPPAVSAQLHVRDERAARASRLDISDWTARRGRVVGSDLLMGEVQDLRGYSPADRDGDPTDGSDSPAVAATAPAIRVEARRMEPVRVVERFPAVTITTHRPGVQLLDFGRHIAGRARVRVSGAPGERVTIRHGEALENDELYTANLRSATQENVFILAGSGDEWLEPEFTIQGFRFVEVSGDLAPITSDDAEALVLQSDLEPTGWFHASDPLLDKLQHNVLWSERGNFVSVPTDCPQRDERLGWTGDINLFAHAAMFNLDCRRFLGTWVRSVADAQEPDGRVYDIAPYPPIQPRPEGIQIAQPGWGDAIIGVPWALYLHYGDVDILREHWDGMRRWMASGAGGEGLIRPASVYRDWNSLGPTTPEDLIGTYWYARAARTMGRIARALGEDPSEFDHLHTAIRDAFRDTFLRDDHRLVDETQTGYAIALDGGLVHDDGTRTASDRLVALLEERDWTVTTGFIGTAALLPALTRTGRVDVAYRIATQTAYPSWGYHVMNDATTMWEHWDTWLPGERFQDAKMNSFNHFALATIGDWFYRYVAGINPDESAPGYQRVDITPHPGGSLPHARARLESVSGTIESSWWRDRDGISFSVTLPNHSVGNFALPWLEDAGALDARGSVGEPANGGKHTVTVPIGPGSSRFRVPTEAVPDAILRR